VVGLLGPNGAGKSTTMKILTSYLAPSAGKASICGHDVVDNPLESRRMLGYLPESNPLYTDMFVREYLLSVAAYYRLEQPRQRVERMIEQTGLGPEAHKRIVQLSKGYRQRVGLAQALVHDPKVLILDEPTSGLDPNQLVGIRELIVGLGSDKTVLLSTHIMQEVEAMCQRVMIIHQGRLVADDSMQGLRARAGLARLELEWDQEPSWEALEQIPGVAAVHRRGLRAAIVEAVEGKDLRTILFDWSVQKGLRVLRMEASAGRNLETVFRELTRSVNTAQAVSSVPIKGG
jgi:ABC-2 type transport system ATP-binding protein